MILFAAIKLRRRLDESDDRILEAAALSETRLGSFGRRFLLGRMVENHGPILVADVRALAIQCGRVVIRPKDVEELLVTDDTGIVFDFDYLGVTGGVAANVFVSRVFGFAAGVTDERF